jgi:hypothetical protein
VDLSTIILIIVFAIVFVAIFLLRLRYFVQYSKMKKKTEKEHEFFLSTFDASKFNEFDAFTFQLGSFSHISPFPTQSDGEWRHMIYLAVPEAEDTDTIIHEITECTLGRVIEKLLNLKKPLYLQRRQDEKFWVSGQRQKYILEHLLASFSEFDDIPKQKQEERIAPEDIKKWQLTTT